MNGQEALAKMVAPGTRRPGKYRDGVVQIHVTRACDKACFNCTQASNLAGKVHFMTPAHFEQAVRSLKGYFGVYGVFGGNPALSPYFDEYCRILQRLVPKNQCGLWCNHPKGCGALMRATFDPAISNLNVHQDHEAYDEFKRYWPECTPVGLESDSRHGPVLLAMKNVIEDEGERWRLISECDINQHWSALIGVFRGQLRAWFCEVAGAQSMLRQDDPEYPDTGICIDPRVGSWNGKDAWWKMPMASFAEQVYKHCHECGVPLRGWGELANNEDGTEQTSTTWAGIYKPKRRGRKVEIVTDVVQLNLGRITRATAYLQNAEAR